MDKEAVVRNDWLCLIFYFQDLKGNLWNILWQVCEPNEVIHRDTEGTAGLLPAEQDSVGCVSYTLLQHGWKILLGKGKLRQKSGSFASALLTREKLRFSYHWTFIIFKKHLSLYLSLLLKHEFSFKLECLQAIVPTITVVFCTGKL